MGLNYRMVPTEAELSETQLLPLEGELQKRCLEKIYLTLEHWPEPCRSTFFDCKCYSAIGSRLVATCRCRTMVPEELNVQRVNSVILMFSAVQRVGASNFLACSESTVVCSLDFFFLFRHFDSCSW